MPKFKVQLDMRINFEIIVDTEDDCPFQAAMDAIGVYETAIKSNPNIKITNDELYDYDHEVIEEESNENS